MVLPERIGLALQKPDATNAENFYHNQRHYNTAILGSRRRKGRDRAKDSPFWIANLRPGMAQSISWMDK